MLVGRRFDKLRITKSGCSNFSKILRQWADRSGSVALVFALALPVLAVVLSGAIDYAAALRQGSRLQRVTDAAALAAANELSMSNSRTEDTSGIVQASAENYLKAAFTDGKYPLPMVKTAITSDPLQVKVNASQKFESLFGDPLGLQSTHMSAHAVAEVVGKPNICLLALEPAESGALYLVSKARMTGNDCSVFSNSESPSGMSVRDGASLTANSICSAGGVAASGEVSPAPYYDCPQFEDPLAGRAEPEIGACNYKDLIIDNQTRTLSPGVYCGGLKISGTSDVTFGPGQYIIKDKSFIVRDSARVAGDGVSFFLDATSWLYFGANTTLSLKALKSGAMAGLLFFGSRSQSKYITHTVLSRNAQTLVGTIYLPRNSFVVDGDANVGGDSAYTAIVARRVVLLNGPHLVLNSDYDKTDVPVPEGIRGAAQPVSLVN